MNQQQGHGIYVHAHQNAFKVAICSNLRSVQQAFWYIKDNSHSQPQIWLARIQGKFLIGTRMLATYLLTGSSSVFIQINHQQKHVQSAVSEKLSGLYSRGTQVPQATTFCLWATGRTYFTHISLGAGHPGFHGRGPSGSS